MASFFNLFPKTEYTLSNSRYPEYQLVTDILFRTSIIKEVLTNSSSYIKYVVRDGDTPDILAAKVYNDPEAHWMILYANDMVDPQFDWPMTEPVFSKYIADKYRDMAEDDEAQTLEDYEVIAWTQNLINPASIHHYEKVISQFNNTTQITNEARYVINKSKLTNNDLTVPYDYYDDLPEEQGVTAIDLEDGQTIIETVYRNAVTYYDYESELNEARRNIRIIKKEYYQQVSEEFRKLTGTTRFPFIRGVA
jgi:hypothetical protein